MTRLMKVRNTIPSEAFEQYHVTTEQSGGDRLLYGLSVTNVARAMG
jgi:hypothetical protein